MADPTEAAKATQVADEDRVKAPWHFWVLVAAVVVYLGWRLIQLIALAF